MKQFSSWWKATCEAIPGLMVCNTLILSQAKPLNVSLATWETLPQMLQDKNWEIQGASHKDNMFRWIPLHSQGGAIPTAWWTYCKEPIQRWMYNTQIYSAGGLHNYHNPCDDQMQQQGGPDT